MAIILQVQPISVSSRCTLDVFLQIMRYFVGRLKFIESVYYLLSVPKTIESVYYLLSIPKTIEWLPERAMLTSFKQHNCAL